ncbi:MAG TPA: 3-carboxy-cis,cis-muconate cycloisomerase [Candidatus Binatia bacterium]|nr:3-carboxy-cis,cis-muconate cycloisomerase [Candidatus Binatia bacterium]
MPVSLVDSLATTEALAEVFSDASILRAMLDFEVALARAEAKLGVIPEAAANAIAVAANPAKVDLSTLSRGALRAGTLSIPLVKWLTEAVGSHDEAAAGFVHRGATSQDVSDTALILLLKRARVMIEDDLKRVDAALHEFSETHKSTIMLGRTLLQPAPPITLGLKAAGWLAAIRRGRERLALDFETALILQFGGAVGTLSVLGNRGVEVSQQLARDLGLQCPDAPWHTHRDRLAALACSLGVVTASLGKFATDVSLLMQFEVREAAEAESPGRGGSSTMPHKRNPIGCAITIASAHRIPGLIASYLSSMVQEHERAVGGIQSEWPVIAAIVQATGLAASSMADVASGLTVDAGRMAQNIAATRGTIYAEKAAMLLASKVGRDTALRLLDQASKQAILQKRSLSDVLSETPAVVKHLDQHALQELCDADSYLGSAELFRQRVLQSSPKHSLNQEKKS